MLKKIFIFLVLVAGACGAFCYLINNQPKEQVQIEVKKIVPQEVEAKKVPLEEKQFTYNKGALNADCGEESEMFCAVDFAVKCTIDPEFEGCKDSKLPKFIFMNDTSLERPTEISFKIHKIKPISADLIEMHTDSACDGVWFGLCKGRVIYVLVPDNDSWRVKDIYAIEDKAVI